MSGFLDVTLSRVPPGFEFFEPLQALFAWVDEQGLATTARNGELYGSLSDDYLIGTQVELRGYTAEETASYAESWFGDAAGNPGARLWPFVQTGGEGSVGALWLDDGRTRIVHLGSGSGSMMTCVLADNGLDFLRLLAIGYEDICWNKEFAAPPQVHREGGDPVNAPFRDWLWRTYGATAPAIALDIVPEPAEMGDEDTKDPFCRWIDGFEPPDPW
ncbi:hypothetical protein [Actinoplanes sp. NBRC 101535]|uniref:hypothetical protein n=1 Tax=Actinoplanes sp. NBRC 101535 TaxID=3032196 RepID=UPI0024A09416|nr:hypothetical protein [Actinoplanes sp. NBRC 101535]GLY04155.1 hypothetical protein Acsp01_45340 [Actinoplanes sp. NBRC 101535]